MAFIPPAYFNTLLWGAREGGDPGDPNQPLLEIRPGELDAEGRPVLALRSLIELKLASGMTAPHRLRDLDDVIQLIRARGLSREYADSIHAYVRPKFLELWDAAQVEDEY